MAVLRGCGGRGKDPVQFVHCGSVPNHLWGSLCQMLGDRMGWDGVILEGWCVIVSCQLLLVSLREHEVQWAGDAGGLAEPRYEAETAVV